ncbi:hypothetical protein A8F94_06775 [Bacillus sp. FJAT-27225]|uniref:hypothetical protein n=1 Tax=Bacillus sp. FJAT-27225 TaxID=1743144 RepID=UPI00080C20E7|nr:hypothetical protein [Bacillus sp. FJAT-27225]OCA87557.1 hypothetical protein A8F94_06775 [Bacillus sp. FJAT-27225]
MRKALIVLGSVFTFGLFAVAAGPASAHPIYPPLKIEDTAAGHPIYPPLSIEATSSGHPIYPPL